MSSTTIETGTILVSDLPPVTTPVRGAFDGLRAHWAEVRGRRAFERAVRAAGPHESSDLLAVSRRG